MDFFIAASLIENIMARITGPMSFRFIIQPAIAIVLGIRDGRMDAKAGATPFIMDLFIRPENRKRNLKAAFRRILVPLVLGTVLDAVAQYLIFKDVPGRYPIVKILPAFLVGMFIVAIPYSITRGITNRILNRAQSKTAAA